MNNSPSNLVSYTIHAQSFFWYLEKPLETYFLVSLSIVENILVLHFLLEMLLGES